MTTIPTIPEQFVHEFTSPKDRDQYHGWIAFFPHGEHVLDHDEDLLRLAKRIKEKEQQHHKKAIFAYSAGEHACFY